MLVFSALDRYGLLDSSSIRGSRIFINCLYHQERTGSLSFDIESGNFYCFGCSMSGSLFTFVKDQEQCSEFEALKILASLEDIDAEDIGFKSYKCDTEPEEVREKAWGRFKDLEKPSGSRLDYLHSRGFTEELIQQFNIRQNVYDSHCIVFPIYQLGEFKGICKRVIGDIEHKYLYNPGLKKSQCISLHINNEYCPIFLTEGLVDSYTVHIAGYPNSAALLGWHCSDEQRKIICNLQNVLKYGIIVGLDNDEAGELGYKKFLEKFDGRVKKFNYCGYKDLNELVLNDERKFHYEIQKLLRSN